MNRVYLTQCLCENRHAICGGAFLAEEGNLAQIDKGERDSIASIEAIFVSGALNRHCGICGSTILKYETGLVATRNTKEAIRGLLQSQADQARERLLLDNAGETYDSKMKN